MVYYHLFFVIFCKILTEQGTITINPNNAQNIWGQELPIIATILIAGFPDVTSINNAAIVTNDEEPVAIDIASQIDHNREFHVRNTVQKYPERFYSCCN